MTCWLSGQRRHYMRQYHVYPAYSASWVLILLMSKPSSCKVSLVNLTVGGIQYFIFFLFFLLCQISLCKRHFLLFVILFKWLCTILKMFSHSSTDWILCLTHVVWFGKFTIFYMTIYHIYYIWKNEFLSKLFFIIY